MGKFYFLLGLLILSTIICGSAFADSSFDFSQRGAGDIGHSAVFTAGAASVQVYGFRNSGKPTDLFMNASGDEGGLGVKVNPHHEIGAGSFVQFADKGLASVSIETSRPGELWALYGSNALGQRGVLIASGRGDGTVSLSGIAGGYTYISLTSRGRGPVLLQGLAALVPEPSSPALMLTVGLFGLAEVGRRRLMA
jgi:hypothetical protein